MCSIAGCINWEDGQPDTLFIKDAFSLMRHRGPDGENYVIDNNVILGHQRLKILDLSDRSNQPYKLNKTYLSFNGEIYNHKEIRQKLFFNKLFETTSDTEVLAKLLTYYGMANLNILNGMFAFAYYDAQKGKLYLVRDRFGVKPLYYSIINNCFYFSSEIKPLIKKAKTFQFNENVIKSFIDDTATDYDESTIVNGIHQLLPGHYLEVDTINRNPIQPRRWYIPDNNRLSNIHSFKSFCENLEEQLTDAVRLRLLADVKVGMSLSGGVDSATLYTLMKENLNEHVECFTVKLSDPTTDESNLVQKLVSGYKDNLHIIEDESEYTIPNLISSLKATEYPIWDNSCITYNYFYKRIRESGTKVIIEGHGSDELLGGYPYMLREAYHSSIINKKYYQSLVEAYVYENTKNTSVGEYKFNNTYNLLLSTLKLCIKHLLNRSSPHDNANFSKVMHESFFYKILPIVLRAFDRMTMNNSIESRAPFMDFRVVELLMNAPQSYKIKTIGSKAPLRYILKKYKKDFIYLRKTKMGFSSNSPSFYKSKIHTHFIEESIKKSRIISRHINLRNNVPTLLTKDDFSWQDVSSIWKPLSIALTEEIYDELTK